MRLSNATLAGITATTAALLLLRRKRREQQVSARFAAASLETLLNAIDANDAETGAHVRRVATYALILAEEAGLSELDRKVVERVALFHDIGKIHEALFDIIHDDASLTPADRRAIATHPQRGAQVLSPLNGFYPELPEGVLSHHERWDGSGYPRGLKGRRIPLSARIVAIADTFDAVTFRRRYHSGQSVEDGRAVIRDGRGTQFDPELVDLFDFEGVFARVVKEAERVASWKPPIRQRRTGEDETDVPDITFRWRPGRQGAKGRAASDEPRKAGR